MSFRLRSATELKMPRAMTSRFRDPELDVLEGKRIECEGIAREGLIIMSWWSVLG